MEEDVFLKKANESIEKQIKDLPGYNQTNSMIKITKKIYQQITGEDLTSDEEQIDTVNQGNFDPKLEKLFEILKRKKQIIFYGPPGTGKTYSANETCSFISAIWALNKSVAIVKSVCPFSTYSPSVT